MKVDICFISIKYREKAMHNHKKGLKWLMKILMLFAFCPSGLQAKKLVIATFPVPEFIVQTNKGIEGFFYELVHNTIKRSGEDIAIKFLPPQRVIQGFTEGEIDAFFPAIENLIPKENFFYLDLSYPKKDYIFGLASKGKVPSTINGLKGRNVGLTIGYPYSDELVKSKNINFVSVHSDEAGIEMLQKSRIDYFVATPNSIYRYIAKDKDLSYDIDSPIIEQKSLLYCKKNVSGKKICSTLKKYMEEVKKSMNWSEANIVKKLLNRYSK